jgi:putative ABC transport system permease protein
MYVGTPIKATMPYHYYLEYCSKKRRTEFYEKFGGKLDEPDRAGKYSMYVGDGFAIPICLGDYLGPYRIVGTTPDYLTQLQHGLGNNKPYTFAQGRNIEFSSEENGFFEAVLGSIVAAELGYQVGDTIYPTHGPEGEVHSDGFKIVGILDPTGTPNDRIALINVEGFYLLDGHVAPIRDPVTGMEIGPAPIDEENKKLPQNQKKPLPIDQREVSAILLKTAGMSGIGLQRQINQSALAQAASPIGEIAGMLDVFFKPAQWALLFLTVLVCLVSAISILVSIYNSMNERTRDIAVMRALGASRDRVLLIILMESILISVGGGFLGWFAGHGLAKLASPLIERRTGISVGFLSLNWQAELLIIPGLVLVGILAGLLPAIMAYRTDVSRSLAA